MNLYAAKIFREDFLNFIAKTYPEFFDENDDYDLLLNGSNEQAQGDVDQFVKDTCGEYEMPCM